MDVRTAEMAFGAELAQGTKVKPTKKKNNDMDLKIFKKFELADKITDTIVRQKNCAWHYCVDDGILRVMGTRGRLYGENDFFATPLNGIVIEVEDTGERFSCNNALMNGEGILSFEREDGSRVKWYGVATDSLRAVLYFIVENG